MTGPVKRPRFWREAHAFGWEDLIYPWADRDRVRRASYDVSAEALLLTLLPPRERERYQVAKEFFVTGSSGGVYLVRHGITGNVYQVLSGQQYCAHLPMYPGTPVEISLVAQLLTISTDEPGFLSVANRF